MSGDAAGRRVLSVLREPARIPLVNLREGDAILVFGLPTAGLLVGAAAFERLVVPLVLAGALVGSVVVVAAPSHLTGWRWLASVLDHQLRVPDLTVLCPAGAGHDGLAGGLGARLGLATADRKQALTGVHQARPEYDAIERAEGGLEAAIEIEPDSMEFATSGEWAAVQRIAARFANDELSFPLWMQVSARPAREPPEETPPTDGGPVLARLQAEYRDRRACADTETHRLRYVLGIRVERSELAAADGPPPTPLERLGAVPVVGGLLGPVLGEDRSESGGRPARVDRLESRVQTVRRELVGEIPGWSSRRLSASELLGLARGFWRGRTGGPDGTAQRCRRRPALDSRDEEGRR